MMMICPSSTRIGGRAVLVVSVAVVAVYCRLSEEWLFFHNKDNKKKAIIVHNTLLI